VVRSFRQLLRRTPFYGAYKRLGHYPDYCYWKLRGEPVRSPHLLKQRTVRDYARRYQLRVLVETGTYYGEMVAAMRRHVERIYSIELDPPLARRAAAKFARYPGITILEGDSARLVPELLRTIAAPTLFWLDAGYYGWAGFPGETGRLAAELDAILRDPVAGHVILIDDARGLDGRNGALTVDELKQRVAAFPDRTIEVKHDIVRITPAAARFTTASEAERPA
jgi:hypothetical protein